MQTERLTEDLVTIDEEGPLAETSSEIWCWTDEVFIDDEWQLREYFTKDDYDKDIRRNRLLGYLER